MVKLVLGACVELAAVSGCGDGDGPTGVRPAAAVCPGITCDDLDLTIAGMLLLINGTIMIPCLEGLPVRANRY